MSQDIEQTDKPEIVEADGAVETIDAESTREFVETDDRKEAAPEWDEATEQEARAFGWKPKGEWAGEVPRGFIEDPRRYMERAESFGPFKKLREQQERTAAEAQERLRRLEAATAAQIKRVREQERARFEQAEMEAFRNGDEDAFKRIRETREAREKEAEPDFRPEPPQTDPVAAIASDHPWLNDEFLRVQAANIVETALGRGEVAKADAKAQAVYAEERLKKYYPHMFAQPEAPKAKASPVEGGGAGPARKAAGFDSLPADAKAAFKRMVAQGTFEDSKDDREFYFREYSNA